MANTWLKVGAGGYAAIGIASLVSPATVPATFGGEAAVASARTEIRAVYGGIPLAVAGLALADPAGARSGAVLSGAMALTRAASMAADPDSATPANKLFCAVELVLMGALAIGGRSATKAGA